MTRKLLHLPIPFKDESPGSFLLRTTEYNGWKSPSALLIALNYKFSKKSNLNLESIFCDKEKWTELCRIFGKQDNENICKSYSKTGISTRSYIAFMNVSIPWKMLRLKSPAICPKCISENDYQKRIWDFKLITACSIHDTKLINSCPKCEEPFKWNRKKVSICLCDYDFKNCPTETVDTTGILLIERFIKNKDNKLISLFCEYVEIYKKFFEWFDEPYDEHFLTTTSAFSAEDDGYMRQTLFSYLKKFINSHALHPRVILSPFLCAFDNRILINTNEILISIGKYNIPSCITYPKKNISLAIASSILGISYQAVMKLFHNTRQCEVTEGKHSLKKINIDMVNSLLNALELGSERKVQGISSYPTNELHEGLASIIPKLLNGEIKYSTDQVMSKGLREVLILRRPDEENLKEDRKYFSLLETAQICNVNYENIRFAVKCGALDRVDSKKTKGTQIYIDKEVAYNFDRLYVFTGSLALKYGCNPKTLAEKLMASGIKPFSGPKIDGGLTYLFRREDIEPLDLKKVDALRNYPTNTGRKNNNSKSNIDYSISLASAANMLDISVQKASQLILNGSLIEYEDLYRRKSVTFESFKLIFNILNNPNSKTLLAAAQALNQTKSEFSYRYIRTKIAKKVDTGKGFYLSDKEFKKVKRFNEKFITSKEAGKILGASKSFLYNLKKTNKIKPAKVMKVGSTNISFFNRSEVLALKARD